jgi:cytosine/adenosine deaminase-related metal-dependent hydrolase
MQEHDDCRRIRGFEIIIQSEYAQYRAAKDAAWKDGFYISTHVEFGNSPIRDLKARENYMRRLDWYGLEYTVHPIIL